MTKTVAVPAAVLSDVAVKPDVKRSASVLSDAEVPVAVLSALADSVAEADVKWECHFLSLPKHAELLCFQRAVEPVASGGYVLLRPRCFLLFSAELCRYGYRADKADDREELSLKASDKFVYPPP